MKKYSRMAYIAVILLIILLGFFIYKVAGKNETSEDTKEKALSEIKFLENKFLNLFNQLNNISFENYTIASSEIKEQKSVSSNNSGNGGQSGSENSGESGGKGSSEGSSSSEGSGSSAEGQSFGEDSENSKDNKKYQIEQKGILTGATDINWDYIKNEVEEIYKTLYSTTVDLYQTSINQENIIKFNQEYDNFTKAVKDEDKEMTLTKLSLLYDYLPGFIESCTSEEKEIVIIKTKNNIFKAYSILDKEEWSMISENVNSAATEFTKLVTNANNKEKVNQYNINKIYVMINELQNAVTIKDKEVFLIKYKNLLEELENI